MKNFQINLRGKLIGLSKPLIMAILNVTPDSFYDGGAYFSDNEIKKRVEQIISEGADIIDIGAVSTKPFAAEVTVKEEIERLDKALKIVKSIKSDIYVSVDTFRSEVVKFAVENYDIDIVNDIFAATADEKMMEVIANKRLVYVMMHIKGTPQNMQINPQYDELIPEILKYFSERINKAVHYGINDIIIDPGFGFGKTVEHNYEILSKLEDFQMLERPILVGLSRKSMIYKYLGITPNESLNATSVLNTISLNKGANILRVHDVKEAVEAVKLVEMTKSFSY